MTIIRGVINYAADNIGNSAGDQIVVSSINSFDLNNCRYSCERINIEISLSVRGF